MMFYDVLHMMFYDVLHMLFYDVLCLRAFLVSFCRNVPPEFSHQFVTHMVINLFTALIQIKFRTILTELETKLEKTLQLFLLIHGKKTRSLIPW